MPVTQLGGPSIIVGWFIPGEYALTPLASSAAYILSLASSTSDQIGADSNAFLLLSLSSSFLLSPQVPFHLFLANGEGVTA